MQQKTVQCPECGAEFTTRSPNYHFCKACVKEKSERNIAMREARRRHARWNTHQSEYLEALSEFWAETKKSAPGWERLSVLAGRVSMFRRETRNRFNRAPKSQCLECEAPLTRYRDRFVGLCESCTDDTIVISTLAASFDEAREPIDKPCSAQRSIP